MRAKRIIDINFFIVNTFFLSLYFNLFQHFWPDLNSIDDSSLVRFSFFDGIDFRDCFVLFVNLILK